MLHTLLFVQERSYSFFFDQRSVSGANTLAWVRLFAHYPSLYKIYSLRSLKCQSYSPHCVTTIPLRRTLNETHDKKLLRHFYFFASFLPITFRVQQGDVEDSFKLEASERGAMIWPFK